MDQGSGLATDISGNVYMIGYSDSAAGITTSGAYQTAFGGGNNDAFLSKFNSAGVLQWATFIVAVAKIMD